MTDSESSGKPGEQLTVGSLDHIALTVSDIETSRQWYEDMLGLKPVQTDPNVFVPYVTNGKVKLALLPVEDGAEFKPPVHQGARACHPAFRTDGKTFQAYLERLERLGIENEQLTHSASRSIYFHDPDGYVIEVTTYDI